MWASLPMSWRFTSCSKPLMAESTKMSSQVPTMTPAAENRAMSPVDRVRRWAQKYFRAMNHSKYLKASRFRASLRLHQGEQQHVLDGRAVRQQHHHPIDADAHAARRRHAVFQGAQEVLVQGMGLVLAPAAALDLLFEQLALHQGVVQFGVGVAHFPAVDVGLELLHQIRIGAVAL